VAERRRARIRPLKLPTACLAAVVLLASFVAADESWDVIHKEAHDVLMELTRETFHSRTPGSRTGQLPDCDAERVPHPWLIVVGFTGGIEPKDSRASGIVAMRQRVDRHVGERPEVVALTFNNFRWRRARTEVVKLVESARTAGGQEAALPQPLIVAYGHSWGAGSVGKFARELAREGLDLSLAIYIDSFTLRNPRLPDNVRYAVNFYQRQGVLRGLPFRGKKKLIPRNAEQTVVLGDYRIKPVTEHWGWSWNPLQPLLYRHHHRIGHDLRLQSYLVDIVNLKLDLVGEVQRAALQEE
jgi:hypothetical protein